MWDSLQFEAMLYPRNLVSSLNSNSCQFLIALLLIFLVHYNFHYLHLISRTIVTSQKGSLVIQDNQIVRHPKTPGILKFINAIFWFQMRFMSQTFLNVSHWMIITVKHKRELAWICIHHGEIASQCISNIFYSFIAFKQSDLA